VLIWLTVYRDDANNYPQLVADARRRAEAAFEPVEKALKSRTYLLGEQFSAADIMMAFTLMAADTLDILNADSALAQYVARLKRRPAFEHAAQKTSSLEFIARPRK